MDLHIKNMVCDRCILVVKQQLDRLDLSYKNIRLGQVELQKEPSAAQLQSLRDNLQQLGFEMLDDKRSQMVENIKNVIISFIHYNENGEFNIKLSSLLEEKLEKDYHYLSALFSSVEGITIEKYAILQRIEKAKEWLMYNEKSLSEIADDLGYSSVQHLSQQFKKITGLTPTYFKQLKNNNRQPIDQIGK